MIHAGMIRRQKTNQRMIRVVEQTAEGEKRGQRSTPTTKARWNSASMVPIQGAGGHRASMANPTPICGTFRMAISRQDLKHALSDVSRDDADPEADQDHSQELPDRQRLRRQGWQACPRRARARGVGTIG